MMLSKEGILLMLNKSEEDLLEWLGESDLSQYGECHGSALNSLVDKGLAEVLGEETEWNNPFIAKGKGIMYRAVRLTEKGRACLLRDWT